jgi:hypothetical protein
MITKKGLWRLRGHSKGITILLFLILALFLYGVVTLFTMRFEKGDVYPVYSSLRTDPLGTKILYESLNILEGISTTRNYRAFSQLDDYQQATIFYFGAHSNLLHYMEKGDVESLENMIAKGSRFVILLYPEHKSRFQKAIDDRKQTKDKQKAKDVKNSDDTDDEDDRTSNENRCGYLRCPISLLDRWGFHIAFQEQFVRGDHAQKEPDISGTVTHDLPESVSWNSALYFDKVNETWDQVYTLKEQPVLIERVYGRGTIVVATDSYFVSNEALLKERHPQLLSWFVGDNDTVIFDETHFGIRENPGIAALARKYRLQGLFAGILVLGILFIWKNSYSLVPARDVSATDYEDDLLVGKDYVTGFVSLLRKNIASRDILKVCFHEWKRSFPQREKEEGEDLKHVQKIIESYEKRTTKQQDLVRDYQRINKILGERKLR